MLLSKRLDHLVQFPASDDQHPEIAVAAELLPQGLQMRQFLLTGAAPGGEEAQHDNAPAKSAVETAFLPQWRFRNPRARLPIWTSVPA